MAPLGKSPALPSTPGTSRTSSHTQGYWRNEEWMNRGMDRERGIGIAEAFFCDSCSNLKIGENFQISHKLGINLGE
jgi:hypothetical protein